MSSCIDFKIIDNHIAVVTFNRPNYANAMSLQLLKELNETLHAIEQEKNIYCTIFTGIGHKAFCAGADLKERLSMTEDEVVKTVQYIKDTINRIERLSMPVICALNGVALGGGLELALACDIRMAASHVKVGLTETTLAIIPGAGGTQRLPRLIGRGQAKRLIFTGKKITAKEAFQIGLIEEITESENVLESALHMAKMIVNNGPVALKQAKSAINKGMEVDLTSGLQIETSHYNETIKTKDRLEGLQAFKEKRPPNYKGE